MCSEYSPSGKTSDPTCLFHCLSVRVCKCVVSVLVLFVVSSLFSILPIVQIMSVVHKKGDSTGPMFSSPIVSLTL
jgi:hypothetical protein